MHLLRRLALAAVLIVPGAARAGDVANLDILGFSADGGIFAFEEYGELDGSGDAYSNRFYIDTSTDRFVAGSPIRIRLEDDIGAIANARAQSAAKGERIVPATVLAANPGFLAGFNAITEYSADPTRMSVNPRPVFAPVDPPLEFRLEEFPLIAPVACENLGDIMGFRLTRINATHGGVTTVVHEDGSVPASRRCPNGYRIGGIQTWINDNGAPKFAVLIAVRSMGFEGPDYRWIAVTGSL
ncbi:MAG: DUF2259 domain-containing protein [Mesorhizobium sp.]|nr:DUF2259 domain-containing protein [Mesorhizobium sp.]